MPVRLHPHTQRVRPMKAGPGSKGARSNTHRHLRLGGVEEADELLVPVALHVAADDGAVEHIEGGKQRRCAMAFVVVGHRPTFFIGRPGWVRSSAWIWLFSSTERTTAWAGGST